MGFADLDRSTLGCCQSPSTALRLWPSAIGRNDDRLGRDEISTPPSQRAGSSGTPVLRRAALVIADIARQSRDRKANPYYLATRMAPIKNRGLRAAKRSAHKKLCRTLRLPLAQVLRCSPSGKATYFRTCKSLPSGCNCRSAACRSWSDNGY
jgi:hypothetical protein